MTPQRRFIFRLALALGWVNPDLMLAHMSGMHLGEWQTYYQLEPWGEERADLRSAIVARTSLLPHLKPHAKPPGIDDFMPDFDGSRTDAKPPQSDDQMMAVLRGFGERKD